VEAYGNHASDTQFFEMYIQRSINTDGYGALATGEKLKKGKTLIKMAGRCGGGSVGDEG